MANSPTDSGASTPAAKTKVSEVEKLKTLVLKIAKSITKHPLSETDRETLTSVASLLYSTANHSELLSEHEKTTSETEAAE